MLHIPPARRSAVHPRVPRRTRTILKNPQLSLTVGDLPPGCILRCEVVGIGHWLVTIRNGAYFGEVAYAHAYSDAAPPWVGERMYRLYGAVSPAVDMEAYRRTRWWHDDWLVDASAVLVAEELNRDKGGDLITPWDHEWLDGPPVLTA